MPCRGSSQPDQPRRITHRKARAARVFAARLGPSVAEAGYPGLEAGTWHLFLGPAGLPREIVAKLANDIVAVLKMADVRERLAVMGVEPIGTTPEELAAIMRADMDKWTRVIRAANIKLD